MSDSAPSRVPTVDRYAPPAATIDAATRPATGSAGAAGAEHAGAEPRPPGHPSSAAVRLTTVALLGVRVTGPILVVLGLLFWTGRGMSLLPVHMGIGLAFVLALLGLAGAAKIAGVRWPVVLPSVVLALVIPPFGVIQPRLLPGPGHWVVRVAHLLLGMAAMVVAARLARSVRARAAAGAPFNATDRPAAPRSSAARDRIGATAVLDR